MCGVGVRTYAVLGHKYLHNSVVLYGNFLHWFGVKSTGSSENIYLPEYLNRTEQNLLITTRYTKPKKCMGQKYLVNTKIKSLVFCGVTFICNNSTETIIVTGN